MKPEEFEVYVIPPNFMEGGTLFGGLLKTRNTIEAVILGLAVGVPVLHLPFSLTVRVVILCLTALPLVLLALIGVSGMSLSAFIRLFFCFLHNRRILSRDGTQGGKNGKTLLPSWAQQRKSDCEAEDPPLPKSRSRFSVDLKQRSVTQFKTFLQEEEAVQPLNALADYIPTRGIDVSRADEYTVATWLRSWYEIYAKPNIRISTANRYQLMVEQYTIPRIGSIKLTKLTAHDLQKLYKDLMENGRIDRKSGHGNPGLSSTTVRSLHLMLHSALERAVKERLILRNPTEDCIAPKVQKIEMQILPPEHIKDYLEAADRRGLLPMFYLELVTGLRKGEITALLWSDLDTQNKTISVSKQYIKNPNGELTLSRPKTETSVRKVSIPQEAVDLLIAEHGKHPENPYMFPSPVTGEMYYPDSVVNLHKKILKDAGLPHIRFHDLRHTFATLALQNGVDVKTVSSMLGHYDAGFTLRTYTHATRQKQDEAAQTMGSFMAQVM